MGGLVWGLAITLKNNGDMMLTGGGVDQAALYGVLKKCAIWAYRDLSQPYRLPTN